MSEPELHSKSNKVVKLSRSSKRIESFFRGWAGDVQTGKTDIVKVIVVAMERDGTILRGWSGFDDKYGNFVFNQMLDMAKDD